VLGVDKPPSTSAFRRGLLFLYSQSVMGIIPRSKRFRIFFLLGGSLFVWAVFVEVFWMPASRHKIRLGRPVMGGAVDEVISRYSDVTGDDAPDEVRLHVAGENWSRPFKWTLTVISDKKTVYECSGDDAGIDKFFNDKGYVSGGCESYLECKKQYYLKDMPANLFAAWPGENKPGGAWAAGMRSAASEELMTKFKLPAEEAAATAARMAKRLNSGGVQVLYVPLSPVQSGPPKMYVPRVGSFVTISRGQ